MSLFSWIKNSLQMGFVAVDLTEVSSQTIPAFWQEKLLYLLKYLLFC